MGDYKNGWRPEAALKQTVLELVAIVFDPHATSEECEQAANTIIEAVNPDVMEQATEYGRRLWEAETDNG